MRGRASRTKFCCGLYFITYNLKRVVLISSSPLFPISTHTQFNAQMDTQAEINADLISSIIPFPNLTDLSNTTSDFDNDIQILLDWLSPYIPATSLTKYQDCGSPCYC